jgi:superfamily II DNA/RNA helicase
MIRTYIKDIFMSFQALNLDHSILKAINNIGYKDATPIQAKAIPEVMLNKHVLATAQTGTGKTAAFVLPILHHLIQNEKKVKGPRVLIISPTRELANQITDSIKKYGRYLKINSVTITGGMSYTLQNRLLSKPVDILIATPGRLLDLFQQRKIKLKDTEIMVLDEADRMLDMGFVPDIRKIFNATNKEQQMLMFSATLDQSISKIAEEFLKSPVKIMVKSETTGHSNIAQSLYYVDNQFHKQQLLNHFLTSEDMNQAIIFTATKRQADKLADELYHSNIKSSALHGDMSQGSRTKTINRFKRNEIKVLVATDLASRGIDVKHITHVFNYDLPRVAEDYVHRIGRTGRADKKGLAISLVNPTDREHLRKIEKFTNFKIEMKVVSGMEPTKGAPTNSERKRKRSGKKRPFIKSTKSFTNHTNATKRLNRKVVSAAAA